MTPFILQPSKCDAGSAKGAKTRQGMPRPRLLLAHLGALGASIQYRKLSDGFGRLERDVFLNERARLDGGPEIPAQAIEQVVHEVIGRRRAGRHEHTVDAFEPCWLQ